MLLERKRRHSQQVSAHKDLPIGNWEVLDGERKQIMVESKMTINDRGIVPRAGCQASVLVETRVLWVWGQKLLQKGGLEGGRELESSYGAAAQGRIMLLTETGKLGRSGEGSQA